MENLLLNYLLRVTDGDDGISTIEIEYKRIVLDIYLMETTIYVDTDIPFIDSVKDYIDMNKMASMMFSASGG